MKDLVTLVWLSHDIEASNFKICKDSLVLFICSSWHMTYLWLLIFDILNLYLHFFPGIILWQNANFQKQLISLMMQALLILQNESEFCFFDPKKASLANSYESWYFKTFACIHDSMSAILTVFLICILLSSIHQSQSTSRRMQWSRLG